MALIVAGLGAEGTTLVEGIECIQTSYPDFIGTCRSLAGPDCIEVTA
jgi:5-enolpyruvylshikimate-3-phosphate synthase